MRRLRWLACLLLVTAGMLPGQNQKARFFFTDFSRIPPGKFAEFTVRGFPEYQHTPLVDGWGRRAVVFSNDGHPDMACLVHDFTGDPCDEIITWDPGSIWIYTQSDTFKGERIYAPRRPPTYNESNYVPVVSWPAWKEVER